LDSALGLIGFVVFAALVILFAAGVTWLVVKLSPPPERRRETPPA
jgi:hypothetical protein